MGLTLYGLAILPLVTGIALRVYITKFAPVTNMFGTMLWVSLGVMLFSLILFLLYQNLVGERYRSDCDELALNSHRANSAYLESGS